MAMATYTLAWREGEAEACHYLEQTRAGPPEVGDCSLFRPSRRPAPIGRTVVSETVPFQSARAFPDCRPRRELSCNPSVPHGSGLEHGHGRHHRGDDGIQHSS